MSTQARVAKLEDLLGRIEKNRRPAPVALGGAAKATPVPLRATPQPAPAAPEAAPAAEEAAADARVRGLKPTPMEMALETMPEPSTEPSMDVEIVIDEGPEITIDADGEAFEEAVPTAPVETRAPEPVAPRAATPAAAAPRAATPAAATRAATPAPAPVAARPIDLPAAAPSGPVARAVSRAEPPEPRTFRELLDRSLALRPRG